MTSLAALGHAYRWDTTPPALERFGEAVSLPEQLAQPWRDVAHVLDVPRVGSAWNLHVCNWISTVVDGGSLYRPEQLAIETMDVAVGWLLPPHDEQFRNFSLLFVMTEAQGASALRACVDAIQAAAHRDTAETASALDHLSDAIDSMRAVLSRYLRSPFVEHADWLRVIQATMPWAVEGDDLSGPNGLQIATVQAIDSTLGVPSESTLGVAAELNRAYMPPEHRAVLAAFDAARTVVHSFVSESRDRSLKLRFNDCVRAVRSWRIVHLKRAIQYLRGAKDAGTRVSTGVGFRYGAQPPSGDGPEQAPADFEETAEHRVRETVSASVAVEPHITDAELDDVAFAFLTTDDRTRLLDECPTRQYAHGAVLIQQGETSRALFLLESGTARIALDGELVAPVRVRAGEVVGEISLLDEGPASASVIAEGEVEATVITAEHLLAKLAEDPILAARFYHSLARMVAGRLRRSLRFLS